MRTNIVINDELMRKALEVSGLKTKKEVVHEALGEYVRQRTRKDLMDLRGKVMFVKDYDYKAGRREKANDVD